MKNLGVYILYFSILILGCAGSSLAQNTIKWNGGKFNYLDKDKKKQGSWVFFDENGYVRLSCEYENDKIISPIFFYENSDTVFVRFPKKGDVETFIAYDKDEPIPGNFVYTSDSTFNVELETDAAPGKHIIQLISKYQKMEIEPVYMFGQKKMKDYLHANFSASNFVFNKKINAVLTISPSGIVSDVEFPKDKNDLSANEERELYVIYSKMPRWQPFFQEAGTKSVKVLITENHNTITF